MGWDMEIPMKMNTIHAVDTIIYSVGKAVKPLWWVDIKFSSSSKRGFVFIGSLLLKLWSRGRWEL